MGNRNARRRGAGLANYGGGYDPYAGYGEIENYGAGYPPAGGAYPYGNGYTDGPFVTTAPSPLSGLGGYGGKSLAGYNPMLQLGLGGPKVRTIFVPNHVVGAFQNLLQQGGGGASQIPCGPPPMMPQMPCGPPPMIPQMPCAPPPMMPQMPCAPPPMMMPQMPLRTTTDDAADALCTTTDDDATDALCTTTDDDAADALRTTAADAIRSTTLCDASNGFQLLFDVTSVTSYGTTAHASNANP